MRQIIGVETFELAPAPWFASHCHPQEDFNVIDVWAMFSCQVALSGQNLRTSADKTEAVSTYQKTAANSLNGTTFIFQLGW